MLLGLIRLVRQGLAAFQFSRLSDHTAMTESHNWRRPLAVALIFWTLAERLLLLGLQYLLVIAGATLIVWVVNRAPFSVDLVNAAIRRAVDAAFVLKLMVG